MRHGTAKSIVVAGSLALALCASSARAASYLEVRELGQPVAGAGARSVAMGATGLARARNAAVYRLNPAVLSDLTRAETSLSAGVSLLTEKVVESTAAVKFRDNGGVEMNEWSAALPFKGGRLWVALGAAPAYDFRYEAEFTDFTNGVPDTEHRLDSSGAVWAVTPAVTVGLTPNFSLGLSYDFWTGSEDVGAFKFSHTSGTLVDLREQADYTGGAPRAGFRWKATEEFSLGFSYQPAGRLTRKYSLVNATAPAQSRGGTDRWDTPAQWGIGFSFRAGGEVPTEVAVDAVQTLWGKARVNGLPADVGPRKPVHDAVDDASASFFFPGGTPRNYHDATEVRVGVEHAIGPEWSLRYGFRHAPYFGDNTVEGTFFTVGVGREPTERWGWSAAAEYGKRDYKGDNLFFPATVRAEETFRRLLFEGHLRW
jgi:hypothetical protein